MACPNCAEPIAKHGKADCMLGAFIDLLRDRGNLSEQRLRKIHESTNADLFWDDVGRIVDCLGDGEYEVT